MMENFKIIPAQERQFFDPETGKPFMSWVMGWECWSGGKKYGDFMMMSDKPEGPILDHVESLLRSNAETQMAKLTG